MKKEAISERDLKALLLLGCIIMLALAYFIGYKGFLQSANATKLENIELQAKLDDLERKNQEKDKVMKETEEYDKKINEIVMKYPSQVTPEKVFYDMYQLQTHLGKLQFTSVVANMNGLFYPEANPDAGADQASQTNQTNKTSQANTGDTPKPGFTSNGVVTVYKTSVDTKLKALSYEALKKLVKEVNTYDGRLTMDKMNIKYSKESGLLEGEISFGMYALEGSPKEYQVPDISGIPTGVKNIFATFDAKRR